MKQITKSEKILTKILRLISSLTDYLLFSFLFILFLIAIYFYIDNKLNFNKAAPYNFTEYKPDINKKGFDELKKINKDVKSWLNIYDTNIDYPVVQAEDNKKYISLDVFGNYALVGSLFLDYRNKEDFSDFSSVIYGHHMTKGLMFGDLEKYNEKEYFEKHLKGSLNILNKKRKVEVFAYINTVSQNQYLFTPQKINKEENIKLLEEIKKDAKWYIDPKLQEDEKILVLYTCSFKGHDKRDLLVLKITNEEKEIEDQKEIINKKIEFKFSIKLLFYILVIILLLLIIIYIIIVLLDKKDIKYLNP